MRNTENITRLTGRPATKLESLPDWSLQWRQAFQERRLRADTHILMDKGPRAEYGAYGRKSNQEQNRTAEPN